MSVGLKDLTEAIREAKERSKPRRFKQSVELIVKLRDVDMKNPANRVNMSVPLPHPPPGKPSKVAVIAYGELALKAGEAGADLIIERDDLSKMATDRKETKRIAKEYDFFFALPDLMPLIGHFLGRYLGPRGKMPSPTPPGANISALIERAKRSVRLRMRDQPQVACRIGVEDQRPEELAENAQAVINAILGKFEPRNIEKIYVKLTMGPPVRVAK